jgi:hypothetical protein
MKKTNATAELKKIAWRYFEKSLLKLGGIRASYRRSYLQAKDDGIGRECIGSDKYGNRYY